MAAIVTIIGYSVTERLDDLSPDPTTSTLVKAVILSCPRCVITKRAAVVDDPATNGTKLDYLTGAGQKPAEFYVLRFDNETDAEDWLDGLPLGKLDGKTVLVSA